MKYIVGIILVLLVFFILFGISGKILQIIKESGNDAACTASAQISSGTKIGGIETIQLNCPIKLIDIKMGDLTAEINKARDQLNRISKYNQNNPNKPITVEYFMNPDSKKLKEYALDQKISEQMRKCWYTLGEGKLDLFNAWYGDQNKHYWDILFPKDKIPITCVVCSRIKFDQDIKTAYPEVKSLNEWLKMNTVPSKDVTYYDYLIDELHDQYLFTMDWSYKTDEPLAVVFARANPQYLIGKAAQFLQFLDITKAPEAVDALYLIPYSQTANYCDYLANKAPEQG